MDIVEFLRARLDEDEATAKAASAGGCWRYEDGDSIGAWTLYDEQWKIASLKTYRYEDFDYATRMPAFRHPHYVDADANVAHIVRHQPARVLREVEAKRRIIDLLTFAAEQIDGCHGLAHRALEALALPCAEHPDYQPEWKP